MTSNISPSSNKNNDLINRLIILEKFIELKSNECAYYRTKVHLMQMNSFNSSITNKNNKRSSSEDISQSSITSDKKHRTNSIPLSSQRKSSLKKNLNVPHLSNSSIPFNKSKQRYRKEIHNNKKTYAQNQNYYEDAFSHSKQKLSSSTNDKNLIEQIVISYINKHFQQSSSDVHDKNIQCNDNDFHPIKTENTVLMIRLPRRFIKSLIVQQKKATTSKLKVHISSELLNKLFQSIYFNSKSSKENQFTIQSQFGTISACINHENSHDKQESKPIHVKAEVKTHHGDRLSIIRHIAQTRSDGSNRKKIFIEKNRRKKRHLHKSSSTSHEESLTNVTQTIETLPSSDQTSNSISIENNKIKKNKKRF